MHVRWDSTGDTALALLMLIAGNLLLNLPAVRAKFAGLVARPDREVSIGSMSWWPWMNDGSRPDAANHSISDH